MHPPFQEEKNSTKHNNFQIFILIEGLRYSNIGVYEFKKEKKVISFYFLHMHSGKNRAYLTNSAFTQHYHESRVLFVPK